MKIYIATDLEGATGVFKFEQTREMGTPAFYGAFRMLMGDIAAVAEGLKQSGVDEILVSDGHNGGNNFMPELMVPGVRYITGRGRPRPMALLDDTADGMILLAYHAMNGTPDGVLHHTQSSRAEAKYWYDGVERGEIYQHALIAGHFGVPVILVTGDEATCREARETLGDDLPTVAVKKGLGRQSAVLIAAEETHDMLVSGAKKAVEALPHREPLKIELPIKARRRYINPDASSLHNPYYVDKEALVERQIDSIF